MDPSISPEPAQFDVAAIMGGLYGDGIIACKGAFPRAWVQRLGEDIAVLFDEARRQFRIPSQAHAIEGLLMGAPG